MVEVFKTNVKKNKQAMQLIAILSNTFSTFLFNFDLDDCDKILRVEGHNIATDSIIEILNTNGFTCEILL